jgi:hypothetical protein
MGVQFHAQNRAKMMGVGGKELPLAETRALRYVRAHRRNPVSAEELCLLDEVIRSMEMVKLLEDFDVLRRLTNDCVARLKRPTARLNDTEKMVLRVFQEKLAEVQSHPEVFHIAQLLTVGDGGDPTLRDLNRAYLHLAVLSNAEDYRRLGHIAGAQDRPQQHLQTAIDELLAGPLGEHLAAGKWFGPPRMIATLPEDSIQRGRVLALHHDYLELSAVANAYGTGSCELPVLGDDLGLLSAEDFRREENPRGWIASALEDLGHRLEEHLANTEETKR